MCDPTFDQVSIVIILSKNFLLKICFSSLFIFFITNSRRSLYCTKISQILIINIFYCISVIRIMFEMLTIMWPFLLHFH